MGYPSIQRIQSWGTMSNKKQMQPQKNRMQNESESLDIVGTSGGSQRKYKSIMGHSNLYMTFK